MARVFVSQGLLHRAKTSFGHAQAHAPHTPCSSGPPATVGVHRLPVSLGGDRAGSALNAVKLEA
jgi:hypothetical protein